MTPRARPKDTDISGRFLRFSDVMDRLQISRSMVYLMVERGEIETVKIGGARRITEGSLNKYLRKVVKEVS